MAERQACHYTPPIPTALTVHDKRALGIATDEAPIALPDLGAPLLHISEALAVIEAMEELNSYALIVGIAVMLKEVDRQVRHFGVEDDLNALSGTLEGAIAVMEAVADDQESDLFYAALSLLRVADAKLTSLMAGGAEPATAELSAVRGVM